MVPLLCGRVQGGRHAARVARWQRIADAAVAQCGRSRSPAVAEPLYEAFLKAIANAGLPTARGVFGAEMKVRLLNDGPVTVIVEKDAAGHARVVQQVVQPVNQPQQR